MQVGEVGVRITMLTNYDISGALVAKLRIKNGADYREISVTPTAEGAYLDTMATTFPTAGTWKLQLYVELGDKILKSPIAQLVVSDDISA